MGWVGRELRRLSNAKPRGTSMLACSAPAVLAEAAETSASGGADFREVTLIPDGVTEMVDGTSMRLDAAAAADIVGEIKRRKVDVLVDLDHASWYQIAKGRPAPAVGWIQRDSVSYVPGVGIRAHVKWNDDGAAYLHSGGYRYTSPIVIFNKKSGRPIRLHSFTLTNTPLTRGATPLRKAASEAFWS